MIELRAPVLNRARPRVLSEIALITSVSRHDDLKRYAINTVTVGLLTRCLFCAELMRRDWFNSAHGAGLSITRHSGHAEPMLPSSLLNCPSPEYR
jgi:hypothetical protein